MIIYEKGDSSLIIPCGLGPVVCGGGGGGCELQSKTVNSSTSEQTVTPGQGYDGLSQVTVNAVTASIDSDIQPGNIRDGVTILGVTGTYEGDAVNNQDKTVNPSTSTQTVISDTGYTGLGTVTVAPMNLTTASETIAENGTFVLDASSYGADGLSEITLDISVEGSGNVEQWPDLLQVYNDEGGVHGGVIFDTGFPIADGLVNNHFEGHFALGQSMEYMEDHSCFIFGNCSAVDPEAGLAYYWGLWQAYGHIIVTFGSIGGGTWAPTLEGRAVFPLSEDGEEGTVSPYDLPVTWDRMENVKPETTGFDSDYVYEVKIGNLVKYAPAHDERMELFNGLNMCVFGRNVEGDPEVYGGHADSGTRSTWLYAVSTDEDEISHELDLTPYKLNSSVTFYETYSIDNETEYDGPLEPILDTHGTVMYMPFEVDLGADITVTPGDTEQHIATINGETIFPYMTVLPVTSDIDVNIRPENIKAGVTILGVTGTYTGQ
jgi:hypothetical protein